MTDTLHDDIKAAMAEVEEPEVKVEEPEVKEPEVKVEEPEVKDPEVKEPEPKKEGDITLSDDRAPRGWTPAAREQWGTIPEPLRKEIMRREEASAQGVRQLQERYAPLEGFVQKLDSYIQEAVASNVAPDQYITSVLQAERNLRNADVPGKFQEILRIADQYGVPLRDIINKSVGQEILAPVQQTAPAALPPEVMRELAEMRTWREQQSGAGITAQIAEFSKDKEFFGDVSDSMANLISSGVAADLSAAYDMACWANPGVREVMLSRKAVAAGQAAAAGASIAPSGTIIEEKEDPNEDLGDTVRRAFARSTTGRV